MNKKSTTIDWKWSLIFLNRTKAMKMNVILFQRNLSNFLWLNWLAGWLVGRSGLLIETNKLCPCMIVALCYSKPNITSSINVCVCVCVFMCGEYYNVLTSQKAYFVSFFHRQEIQSLIRQLLCVVHLLLRQSFEWKCYRRMQKQKDIYKK